MTRSSRGWLTRIAAASCPALMLLFGAYPTRATTAIVPDDIPTVQAALDTVTRGALIDTVLVRASIPQESPYIITSARTVFIGVPDSTASAPTLNGLTYSNVFTMVFQNFHFAGTVVTLGDAVIELRRCQLDRGLNSTDGSEMRQIHLTGSTLHGPFSLALNGAVYVDSCKFDSTYISCGAVPGGDLFVSSSTFTGGTFAIGISEGIQAIITGNHIRGCGSGIWIDANNDATVLIDDNLIEDCSIGISIDSYDTAVSVVGNEIRQCGTGVNASVSGQFVLHGNTILDSNGDGVHLAQQNGLSIMDNVVGRSGGYGFFIARGDGYGYDAIHNNTSFANGGSGFRFDISPLASAVDSISHNIGYQNRGHGLLSTGSSVPVASCNDWFANDSSAVAGMPPSPEDLMVDPRFCDVANNDVHLAANSPLRDASGCGPIGALGVGCEMTPTLVSLFTAERVPDGVRLRWRLGQATRFDRVGVERAEALEGPWTTIEVDHAFESDVTVGIDRNVLPGRNYWYRLVARRGDGTEILTESLEAVAKPVVQRFELSRVAPNPGAGPIQITFATARRAQVDINVLDVQGRVVASLTSGSYSAGEHVVQWKGNGSRGPAPSGLYLVRYRYPAGQDTRRFTLCR